MPKDLSKNPHLLLYIKLIIGKLNLFPFLLLKMTSIICGVFIYTLSVKRSFCITLEALIGGCYYYSVLFYIFYEEIAENERTEQFT